MQNPKKLKSTQPGAVRLAARASLNPTDGTLRGFRRTCITAWLRAGLDVRKVMALAGHSQSKAR